MTWEIYWDSTKIGVINADGGVHINDAKVGFVTARGDVYDRTMGKVGQVKANGDVFNRSVALVGSVSPSGDIYAGTKPTGHVVPVGADAASGLSIVLAGGAALLFWPVLVAR